MKNGRGAIYILRTLFWVVACFYCYIGQSFAVSPIKTGEVKDNGYGILASESAVCIRVGYESVDGITGPGGDYSYTLTCSKKSNTIGQDRVTTIRYIFYVYQCMGGTSIGAKYFAPNVDCGPCPVGKTYNPETGTCGDICPPGKEKVNGQCVSPCPAGQVRDSSGLCVDKCASTAGKKFSLSGMTSQVPGSGSYGTNNMTTCVGQCKYGFTPGSISGHVCFGKTADGKAADCWTYYSPNGQASGLGTSCGGMEISLTNDKTGQTVDTPPADTSDSGGDGGNQDGGGQSGSNNEDPDPGTTIDSKSCNKLDKCYYNNPVSCITKGMKPNATSNGYVCTNPSGDTTVTKTSSDKTVNGDGTTTTTSKDTTKNGDGTVKTTTTTTTTDGNGTVITNNTVNNEYSDEKSFCESNPNSSICKKTSVSGNCDSFTCDGDAVNCEIAKVSWKSYCEGQKETKFTEAGNKALDGSMQGENMGKLKEGLGKSLSPGSFNQASFLSGGCISDKTFSVAGRSFTMPFSSLCNSLQLIGKIIMAIAFLVSLNIVFGKRE